MLGDLLKVDRVQDSLSACHHEAEEHKQGLPGLPARALPCPGSSGQAAGTVFLWDLLSPPLSSFPKAPQAVAEGCTGSTQISVCHTEELFLHLCNQPQPWLLHCKQLLHVGFIYRAPYSFFLMFDPQLDLIK